MHISKVNIENFKCFKGLFSFEINNGLNILVGDNESGKSTILESIHLALTGLLHGKYLRNDLTQNLFNNEVVAEYLDGFKPGNISQSPPYILIEVFIHGEDLPIFEGDGNREKKSECCIKYKIAFADNYQPEYEKLIANGNIKSIPIEYYDVFWETCARESITSISIPIKSALIDSSSNRYQNGSDVYISHIVRNMLSTEQKIEISQAHRKMKEAFMDDEAVKKINDEIKGKSDNIHNRKTITLEVELSSKNAWENSLLTYVDKVPFHYIGKGEQSIVKTKLALEHKKSNDANIILLEEPENHLSHSKLNQLISIIKSKCIDKQILISTHNSFVANKLGLKNLILLNNNKPLPLKDLKSETINFFQRISGYDTLRLILCEKAILVEGDSDELYVQKAYIINNSGRLPIDDGIDVISVGTSFLKFLEIADKIDKPVCVVTDNDGDIEGLMKKYENYMDSNEKKSIKICFDDNIDTGDLVIGKRKKPFNYNTLEPKFLKANNNNLTKMNTILGTQYDSISELHKYMRLNKTECALKIFETKQLINFPQYILDAIQK